MLRCALRCLRRSARRLLVLGMLLSGFVMAAAGDVSLTLPARDGHPLHIARYRPPHGASGAVLLLHEWGSAGISCWGALAESLCSDGWEVLVPDLRGHGASREAGTPEVRRTAPTRAELAMLARDVAAWWEALGDSVQEVTAVAVGWSGHLLPAVARGPWPLTAAAWITPRGEADNAAEVLVEPSSARLLLLVGSGPPAPSRLAEVLYTRFNRRAEVRFFSRMAEGCPLARERSVMHSLRGWLRRSSARAG